MLVLHCLARRTVTLGREQSSTLFIQQYRVYPIKMQLGGSCLNLIGKRLVQQVV
jgi:hypothetical protein